MPPSLESLAERCHRIFEVTYSRLAEPGQGKYTIKLLMYTFPVPVGDLSDSAED